MAVINQQRVMAPRLAGAGYLLGFALGGFFDGILLHQVLQWHHLLSGVDALAADLRFQVLADGLFHAFMYVVALAGLVMLWRARRAAARNGTERVFLADVLIGFGVWHVLDSVLSHWLLGIHRIRMDSPQPLLWDLIWFGCFGLLPVAAGMLVKRRGGPGMGRPARRTAAAAGLLVLIAGPVAALPPPGSDVALVVFRSGTPADAMLAAVAEADARAVWTDGASGLIAVAGPADTAALYRRGALLVSRAAAPFGCLIASRPI